MKTGKKEKNLTFKLFIDPGPQSAHYIQQSTKENQTKLISFEPSQLDHQVLITTYALHCIALPTYIPFIYIFSLTIKPN